MNSGLFGVPTHQTVPPGAKVYPKNGGTGIDTSASTGVLYVTAGTFSVQGTTGTGNFVRMTSPSLVTPNLGTPSACVATNFTGTASGLTAGAASVLATARTINGVSFNGSADITVTAAAGTLTGATLASGVTASSLTSVGTLVGGATGAGFTVALATSTITGILGSANGGTANGFTKFTGPASSEKTFTLPNASCTVLTTNAVVTSAQGGTGVANNAASTITISGSFGLTLTLTNTTSVTLPTSGTLLTAAGAVTAITGTANQVIASASVGAVTLSLPQSIGTASVLQFGQLGIGVAPGANYPAYFRTANGYGLLLENADNVGNCVLELKHTNNGNRGVNFIDSAGSASAAVTGTGSVAGGNSKLLLQTDGAARATATSTGLGIGTDPSYRLHCVANAAAYAAWIENANTSGRRDGLVILGGHDVNDYALLVDDAANTKNMFTVLGNGTVCVGGASAPSGGGPIALVMSQTSGNPTGMPTDTCGIFGKNIGSTCELHAIDEAGNVTLLSSHAFDGPAWLYDSPDIDPLPRVMKEENTYLGFRRWTNESRRARLHQRQLAGEDVASLPAEQRTFVHEERFAPTDTWGSHRQVRKAELAAWMALPAKQRLKTPCPEVPAAKPMPAWLADRVPK
jgi:hypothetical protein